MLPQKQKYPVVAYLRVKDEIKNREISELEVDENLLTPEQKEAYKLKFPLGLLIFIIVGGAVVVFGANISVDAATAIASNKLKVQSSLVESFFR